MINKSLGLGVSFLAPVHQECYQLLHVGPLSHLPPLHYKITCYFQPWQQETFLTSNAEPVARQIDIRRAAHLIPGSLWDSNGKAYTSRSPPVFEHRQWFAGARPYRLVQLREIVELTELPRPAFWTSQGDTWVALLDHGKERILIPCFELLRFFYYHAGPRVIQYLFSQLPLNLLCRPHMSPSRDTKHQAQMYVAATYLNDVEARVLGSLLFDPICARTLNQAHNQWAETHKVQISEEKPVYAKTTGQLGHNVMLRGEGSLFTNGQQEYFWITSLTPLSSPHNFRFLLYHPLGSNVLSSAEPVDFPICSDLLGYGQPKSSTPKLRLDPLEPAFSQNGRVGPHAMTAFVAEAFRSPHPAVERGPIWARASSASKPLVWFDSQLSSLHSKTCLTDAEQERVIPDAFIKLLKSFSAEGYPSKMLKLYNSEEHFGPNVSVFPHRGFPPLPGSLYQHRVRRFHIAQIELSSGLFFILHFPHLPDWLVLSQKQNLGTPTDTEWNRLLTLIYQTHSYSDIESFSARHSISVGHYGLGPGTLPLAHIVPLTSASTSLCLLFAERTLACFRQRLALNISLMVRYPEGIDATHWKRIMTSASKQWVFRSPTPEWVAWVKSLRSAQQYPRACSE
ncbi:hypothetical protein [Hymenobacter agri]